MWRWLKTRLTSVISRDRLEGDLDRELAFHIDMLTEQHVRAGAAPAEARRLALREFGRLDGVKEAVRESWLSRAVETLLQDARYGVRNLRRAPGFACIVVLTMALGIGANTAIFSVVNGVLLRPLPYADADRLLVLRQQRPLAADDDVRFSFMELEEYRREAAALIDGIAEFHEMWFILLGGEEPARVATGVVSSNFFGVLGVTPLHGRGFVPADEGHDAPPVLLLSHGYWQREFAGDPGIVGRLVEMNDRAHRIIGVLPPVPQYPAEVDVYMPTSACPFRSAAPMLTDRHRRMAQAIARMRPGVTPSDAQLALAGIAARMQAKYPDVYPADLGFDLAATPLQADVTRSFRTMLLVLLGTAAFVLLIVCASVANLTLARLVRRERELAVRAALGASRRRLLGQLLTESTLLALVGGLAGLAVAAASLDLLIAFAERFTSRAAEVRIDRVVLLYTLLVSAATGIVFGSVPALAGRFSTVHAPRVARASQATRGLRSALIVAQVAVSFMLLVGAGLTIRTLQELQQVDPGFRTDDIMTMRVDLNFTKYDDPFADRAPFWEQLEARLRAIPGVTSVGGAGTFPLNDLGPFNNFIQIEGRGPADGDARPRADVRLVTPDYFSTLGQPLVSGRAFTREDRVGAPEVVIVSRAMAHHYWPGEDPIGRRISGDGTHWATVVGVVADARQQLHRAPGDEIYVPMFQSGQLSTNWLLRTGRDAGALAADIRAAVRALDAGQPVDKFRTLADVRLSSLESPRLTAMLLGLFAGLALLITAAGLAGVVAFSVSQRTQEFGVRMALGADRRSLLALVLRQGLVLVLMGLAFGTAGALVMTRMMTTLLFGVEPTDAITFLAVAMVLMAVAAVACIIPARRAAAVDPLVALRVG
jgi:putative ABC transport system permease protein